MVQKQITERKDQIRKIACKLFLEDGLDETSMNTIAEQAGVSKRTPYIYYENKHDLFSAVILSFLEELEQKIAPLWSNEESQLAVIKNALQAYAGYAIENPAKFNLIMLFEKRDFYPGRRQDFLDNALFCQQTNERLTLHLQNSVKAAIDGGELKTPMTPAQFSLLLWSSLSGVLSIAIERDEILADVYDWTSQHMINQFIDTFFNSSSSPNKDS